MIIDRFFVKDPSVKRHLAKTLTWRVVGTVDTMLLGWFISGNPMIGLKIGGLEVVTKIILYFFHERIWFRVNFGLPNRERNVQIEEKKLTESKLKVENQKDEKLVQSEL